MIPPMACAGGIDWLKRALTKLERAQFDRGDQAWTRAYAFAVGILRGSVLSFGDLKLIYFGFAAPPVV